jgi:hypothetical protein
MGTGMKGISRNSARGRKSSRCWTGWAVAGIVFVGGVPAEAVAIHHESLSPAEATAFDEWSHYLKAGPKMWERVIHPSVTPAVRGAIWESVKTDPGGADPMVRYLLWKQSLDPTRFAYYHPKLAPALHKIARSMPSAPQMLNPPPPGSGSSTGTQPPPEGNSGGTPTSPVPEPSSFLLAAGMAGWAVWRAHRRNPTP